MEYTSTEDQSISHMPRRKMNILSRDRFSHLICSDSLIRILIRILLLLTKWQKISSALFQYKSTCSYLYSTSWHTNGTELVPQFFNIVFNIPTCIACLLPLLHSYLQHALLRLPRLCDTKCGGTKLRTTVALLMNIQWYLTGCINWDGTWSHSYIY